MKLTVIASKMAAIRKQKMVRQLPNKVKLYTENPEEKQRL